MLRRSLVLVIGVFVLSSEPVFAQANSPRGAVKPMPTQKLVGFLKGRSDERRAEALAMLDSATVQESVIADALKDSVD